MPGKKYASIKNPRVYEALKRSGKSKSAAAAISNSRRGGGKSKGGKR
jgi:hypothetical protein